TRSTPEDQAQNKTDAERGENRLGRVLSHILLGVFLKRAGAISRLIPRQLGLAPGFIPGVLGLAAGLARDRAGRRPQRVGRFPRVPLAALQFVLSVSHSLFVFFSHWFFSGLI